MAVSRFSRGKCLVLVAVLFVAGLCLLSSNLRQETVLVPVRTDRWEGAADKSQEIVISLGPPSPVLSEGDSFQLTCTAKGADEVFFELPNLETNLLSSVTNQRQYGRAVLAFGRVELGHQGTYVCHAVNRRGDRESRTFDMVVFPGEDKNKEREEEEEEREEGEGEDRLEVEIESLGENIAVDSQFSVPVFETMEDRAQYQREQVDKYCKRYNMDDVKYKLPVPLSRDPRAKNNKVYSYNRHLLLDDTHRILFCFVPKVGCTNLKLLVFVSQRIIRRSELKKSRDEVNQRNLEDAMFRNSFISIKNDQKKLDALQNYYKYTMFRNPLERLASGYRSKVERFPLVGLRPDSPHFNWLRKDIYEAVRPDKYRLWMADRGKTPVNISFADFIEYWANNAVLNKVDGFLDEHFLMISEMCQPCRTRFDFYGNFRHFNRDAQVLIDKIGGSSSDLRQSYYSDDSSSTDQRMKLYYSTLSETQKRDVLRKMALELEFHYTIFPEERDSHKQILGIDADLPLP